MLKLKEKHLRMTAQGQPQVVQIAEPKIDLDELYRDVFNLSRKHDQLGKQLADLCGRIARAKK